MSAQPMAKEEKQAGKSGYIKKTLKAQELWPSATAFIFAQSNAKKSCPKWAASDY